MLENNVPRFHWLTKYNTIRKIICNNKIVHDCTEKKKLLCASIHESVHLIINILSLPLWAHDWSNEILWNFITLSLGLFQVALVSYYTYFNINIISYLLNNSLILIHFCKETNFHKTDLRFQVEGKTHNLLQSQVKFWFFKGKFLGKVKKKIFQCYWTFSVKWNFREKLIIK